MNSLLDTKRRRVFFCACDNVSLRETGITKPHLCDPSFMWYEPQDIIKGIGIAKKRGLPDGFFVPYKLCNFCYYNRCKGQYD